MSDELKAGPELDAIVAEKVMGLIKPKWVGMTAACDGVTYSWDGLPKYSTSIAAAFEMENEIERRGLIIPYVDCLYDQLRLTTDDWRLEQWGFAHATPHQRSLAALKAVEGK